MQGLRGACGQHHTTVGDRGGDVGSPNSKHARPNVPKAGVTPSTRAPSPTTLHRLTACCNMSLQAIL